MPGDAAVMNVSAKPASRTSVALGFRAPSCRVYATAPIAAGAAMRFTFIRW